MKKLILIFVFILLSFVVHAEGCVETETELNCLDGTFNENILTEKNISFENSIFTANNIETTGNITIKTSNLGKLYRPEIAFWSRFLRKIPLHFSLIKHKY